MQYKPEIGNIERGDGGGEIISGPKMMGTDARYCAIQDPAGGSVFVVLEK